MNGPDPQTTHPIESLPRSVFLKHFVHSPRVEIGDYTYYDDPHDPEKFENHNILYLFDHMDDRLVIGKFCALAHGTRFIMNGANHPLTGFSTYPFFAFGNGWEVTMPAPGEFASKGDTVVGHDVWLGFDALVMPGVTIGSGAIVATRAVVAHDVPPYAVVAGNPARVVKMRFPPDIVQALLDIAWWDWPIEKITRHLKAIAGADLAALRAAGEGE